ncbi:hypothetical protein EBR21_04960 [bacterium]|nr:hypothetical protein [bacterium]
MFQFKAPSAAIRGILKTHSKMFSKTRVRPFYDGNCGQIEAFRQSLFNGLQLFWDTGRTSAFNSDRFGKCICFVNRMLRKRDSECASFDFITNEFSAADFDFFRSKNCEDGTRVAELINKTLKEGCWNKPF